MIHFINTYVKITAMANMLIVRNRETTTKVLLVQVSAKRAVEDHKNNLYKKFPALTERTPKGR